MSGADRVRAHRALIVRELKGLQDIIELSVVHPHMGKGVPSSIVLRSL